MLALARVHTGEEHLELIHVHVRVLVARDHVFVALVGRSLGLGSILRVALLLDGDAHVALHLQFHRRVIDLSVQQRRVAVLLAVQVIFQREHVVRRVLVHRRVGRAADDDGGVARVTDHQHRDHHGGGVQHSHRHFLALYHEDSHQGDDHQDTYPYALFDERDTRQGHRQHERNEGARVQRLMTVRGHDGPNEGDGSQNQVDAETRVERQVQRVHEEQLKPARQRRNARDHAVEDSSQYQHTGEQREERALPRELVFVEIVHQHDGRNGQQVQQVDADRETHQVRNQDQPAVTARLFCVLVPFQDSPEHHGGEQARRGIHLAFHGREPERVAERVRQRADSSRSQDCQHLPGLELVTHEFLAQRGNRPK